MEKKKVNFVRYTSSEGMSLKWKEFGYDYQKKKMEESTRWEEKDAIIDENNLIGEVEEIPYSQYLEETKHCAFGSIGF